jgi:phenylpropionate dioxygenase-like ring-hydroxylating dioxygenase large terminal subunit
MPGQKYFYPCNWLQIMENAMDPAHTAFLHTIVSGSQFTEEFGVLPELEFVETPVGMIYIATRRVGDNVWARMVEAVLPNLQQVGPIWEDGRREHEFCGPMMSRWIVPVDDTNTMFLEFRQVSEAEGVTPAWWAIARSWPRASLPRNPTRPVSGNRATMRHRSRNGQSPFTDWSISAPPTAVS